MFAIDLSLVSLILLSAAAQDLGAQGIVCVLDTAESGHIVTIRGRVVRTMHDVLLEIPNCTENPLLAFAGKVEGLYAPSATEIYLPDTAKSSATTPTLKRNRDLERLEKYARAMYQSTRERACIGCYKYDVVATFTGLIERSEEVGIKVDRDERRIVEIHGFGHPTPFTRYRLVVESVADVVATRLPKPGKQ